MHRLPLATLSALLLLVPLAPVGHAEPAKVVVTGAWYETGGFFHVEGTIKHPAHVKHISVAVPGGNAVATISGTAFSATVRGIVHEPGSYPVTLTVALTNGNKTTIVTPVQVVGVYTVFYDREVHTSIGAYANVEEIIVPHLYGGKIAIAGLAEGSSVLVQQVNTAAPVPQCLAVGAQVPSLECSFAVRASSSPMEIVWTQAPQSTVTVAISGYVL